MSEEKKEKLKEYQKNYCEAKKSQYNSGATYCQRNRAVIVRLL